MPPSNAFLLQLSGHLPTMARKKTYSLWDMYSSGLDLAATAVRAGETMLAANAVINSRVGTMGAAARNPITADYAELAKMIPEKLEAFSRAGASLMKDAEAAQAETAAQMRHVTAIMTRYPPSATCSRSLLARRVSPEKPPELRVVPSSRYMQRRRATRPA